MARERSWTYTPRTMAAIGLVTFLAALAAAYLRTGSVEAVDFALSALAAVIIMLVFRWRWKY